MNVMFAEYNKNIIRKYNNVRIIQLVMDSLVYFVQSVSKIRYSFLGPNIFNVPFIYRKL